MKRSGGCYDRLSPEDSLLASHIADMAQIAEKKYIPRFSAFLDGRQAEIARSVLGYEGVRNYMLYGGFEGAERVILGVFPEYSEQDESTADEFPIDTVIFRYRKEKALSHRDFLGAFMSCGVNRNMIGDIIVGEGYTAAFVYNTVSAVIASECTKIGNEGVKVSCGEKAEIDTERNFSEISGTVSSLRLDCIVSLAVRVSREKSAQLIRSERVTVNYDSNVSCSHEMKAGDVFSVRGFGKFILSDINGRTKKDRIHICVKKYI
jgi:RNA-binding protein YlmH